MYIFRTGKSRIKDDGTEVDFDTPGCAIVGKAFLEVVAHRVVFEFAVFF
jgi:hypothetical protein